MGISRTFERIKESPSIATFVNLWPYLKPEKWWMALVIGATLLLTVAELAFPILIGQFIDFLVVKANDPTSEAGMNAAADGGFSGRMILILLAVAAVWRGAMIFVQRAVAGRVGQKVSARMRDALWSHLQKLPVEYTRRRGPGRLLVRFISDARAVQRLVSRGIVQLLQDALVMLGVLVVLIYLDLRMGLIAVGLIPLIGIVFWLINPRLQGASKDMRRRRSRLSAHLNNRIQGLEVVKSYGHQRAERREVRRLNRNVVKHGTRRDRAGALLLGVSAGAVALVTVLIIGVASFEVAAGRLTAGELLTFYALVGMLAPIFQRITVVDRTLQEAQISVQRFTETLAQPTEDGEEKLPKLEVDEGTLAVEDLAYEHPDGTRALDGINLVARRGEMVVITGPNGSGKSTLMELLVRFRDSTEGTIYLDGQDISGVSLSSLRSSIGLVTCDTPLFDGTIRENIAYGSTEEVSDERLEEVARMAGVSDLISSLPDGWDTKVREGRRMLSEGERQKVALARTLVSDPEVILLDQPASSMDGASLQAFAANIKSISQDRTVIVATHQASAILAADRVYAINDGHAMEVSADALRDRFEEAYRNSVESLFASLAFEREPARQTVRVAASRRELDDDEDDDE